MYQIITAKSAEAIRTKLTRQKMAPAQSRMENVAKFREEVIAELNFMKQFPILDQTARKEAEKARKDRRSEMRKSLRNNAGPPLLTEEAEEAEKARKNDLRIIFNKESARWAKIKYEAEVLYQKWLNPILTKMSAEADVELFDSICEKVEMKGSIASMKAEIKKTREIHEFEPGNGGMGSGLGTSAFTMGTQ